MSTARDESFQEADVWLGSYSGWTMMPGLAVCLGFTATVGFLSWRLLEKGWAQFAILTLIEAIWLGQCLIWCYRLFGYNYRLTTARIFCNRGLFYLDSVAVTLESVAKVEVQPRLNVADVGSICLTLNDPQRPKLVLDGISHPAQVAELMRKLVSKRCQALQGASTGRP